MSDLQVFNDLLRQECSSLGGSLGSIHSKEENDFVFNLIILNVNDEYIYYGMTWLGATCADGAYKWDDGTAWEYENWNPGYSSNLFSTILFATVCEENY